MVVEGISAHHLAGSISQVTSQVPHKLCFRGTRRIHTFGPKFLEQKLIRWSKLSSELRNCSATVSLPVFRRSTGARRSEQTIYSILHIPLSGGGGDAWVHHYRVLSSINLSPEPAAAAAAPGFNYTHPHHRLGRRIQQCRPSSSVPNFVHIARY